MLNEAHFTYSRESRPRTAVSSPVPADTGMGFDPTFRFGNPFFLQPNVDELIWRTQFKNNLSYVTGKHTFKFGGEWMHTLNDQVFRGFFTGRYIFDSVTGFLRYAASAASGGFGPNTVRCPDGAFVSFPSPCAGGATPSSPLLLYLQGAGLDGPATDAAGASNITNDEFSLFVQDQWQPRPNLTINYGLRWDAQLMPETVPGETTAYGAFLNDPAFPSDGTIPDQWTMFQPRGGVAWDIKGDGTSVLRGSAGIYSARQNMLSQVGSVTTNGIQQQTIFRDNTLFFLGMPTWPGVMPVDPVAPGTFPLFSGVRVFHRDYKNPRIYSYNAAYEQQLVPDLAAYVDFTWAEGTNLTRFLNYNRSPEGAFCCTSNGNSFVYPNSLWGPQLGEVMVANSLGESRYRGFTLGLRKRFSSGYQLEGNYVLAKDEDNDSNERDPFTDRSFNFFDLEKDWAVSDRDIRHKLNLFGYFAVRGFQLNGRLQARSAQPITPSPRSLNGVDRGRNTERKDNAFFSFDWRIARPFGLNGGRVQVVPMLEMFNTFNSDNNINPLSTPALFDFNGFLRAGVGDPRQVQLAIKMVF
jgi:hypothetical protein